MERWRTALPMAALLVGCSLLAAARTPHSNPGSPSPATLPPTVAADDLRVTPIVRVVQMVGAAVVNIYSDIEVENRLYNFLLGPQVRRMKTTSLGSGVIIDPAGFVVTNAHVLTASLEDRIPLERVSPKVRLRDGREYEARLLSIDYTNDLAVLQIAHPGPFPSVKLGTSSDLMIGETAIAVGNPYGYENSVTSGIISGTGKTLRLPSGQQFKDFIQTDASLNQGNSGGPLFNIKGELIGINELIARDPEHGARAEGIGIAIPADRVRKLLIEKLLHPRAISSFDTGLQVKDGQNGSVQVAALTEGGAAEAAKLEPDDVITSLNGLNVTSALQFQIALITADKRAGDKIEVGYRRDGKEHTAKIVLRSANRFDPDDMVWERMGVRVTDDRTYSGAFVEKVRPNSPASDSGVQAGDTILSLAGVDIDDSQTLAQVLKRIRPGTHVSIAVERTSEGEKYGGEMAIK